MKNFNKCSLEELKNVWEKFGLVVFDKFEDYVVEVRKVESDLQKGKITLKNLKDDNDTKIHKIQAKFEVNNEASLK